MLEEGEFKVPIDGCINGNEHTTFSKIQSCPMCYYSGFFFFLPFFFSFLFFFSGHAYLTSGDHPKVGSNTIGLMKYVARERTKMSTLVSFVFVFGK